MLPKAAKDTHIASTYFALKYIILPLKYNIDWYKFMYGMQHIIRTQRLLEIFIVQVSHFSYLRSKSLNDLTKETSLLGRN